VKARLIARGLAVAGVLLAVLAVRIVSGARTELQRGERLLGQRDPDGAILALRRAAQWYAPANPYNGAALDRLKEIAERAERDGEPARALAAHRAVRGAILSTRSFYVPHRERLDAANREIARLTRNAARERLDPEGRSNERRQRVLRELRAPPRPKIGWTLLLLTGWIAWTGGAFVFAHRAIDEEDRIVPTAARIWGTVILLGFGLFVIGMALA
jgi:hypothetical protein